MAAGDWDMPHPGWTCAECGFVFDDFDPNSASESIAKTGKRLRAPLTRALKEEDLTALLRTRPEPDHWSALEYACHIRDVLDLNVERITRVLAEDRPTFQAMDRDAAVTERNYNGQDPAAVADEIDSNGAALAALLESVPSDSWQRAWVRDEFEFSIDWAARNVQHEVDHHLLDIGRTLRHVRGR
jgi:hypothetical protein